MNNEKKIFDIIHRTFLKKNGSNEILISKYQFNFRENLINNLANTSVRRCSGEITVQK